MTDNLLLKTRVSLDSRLVKKGDYFVPVVGESFDGHKFADQAKINGAIGIIEENELYTMARKKLNIVKPLIIAVTGSVGKSTTTLFISTLLSTKYKVTLGNLNTKLGLATNIMNDINKQTEYFVAECGMDKIGELKNTGEFLNPDIVVLTNISESHMEKLGSLENIIMAKGELLSSVKKDGLVYINKDNKHTLGAVKFSNSKNIINYSVKEKNILPKLLPVIGDHNYSNMICAYKVSLDQGIPKSDLDKQARKLTTPKGRMRILEGVNDSVTVDDTYNSSPVSAKYALEAVIKYHKYKKLKGRKIAVLGGMLELGKYENEGHKVVGKALLDEHFDIVLLVGKLAKKFDYHKQLQKKNIIVVKVDNNKEAVDYIINNIKPKSGDLLLFKASQGARLEKTLAKILKDPSLSSSLLVRQDVRWK